MKIFLIICLLLGFINTIEKVDDTNFDNLVINDTNVWVIEIGSIMCDSCQEFAPKFKSVSHKMNKFKFGFVKIDDPEGLKLAKKYPNVFTNGLPYVIVYDSFGSSFKEIVKGNVASEEELEHKLNMISQGLEINNGIFQKRRHADL